MTAPWTERHRPRALSEVAFQEEAVSALRKCLERGSLPNLLLFGPAGTGKTSAVHALAHELFGPKYYRQRLHEFNASSDRGIRVIRERVKSVAQGSLTETPEPGYPFPCPPLRLVVLDEADALTKEAQAALRRVMEDYSRTTRFCILCNYPSQIIDPIVSRCARFRFQPLPSPVVQAQLESILRSEVEMAYRAALAAARASEAAGQPGSQAEGSAAPLAEAAQVRASLDPGAVEAARLVAQDSAGDMRRAVTMLQVVVDSSGLDLEEAAREDLGGGFASAGPVGLRNGVLSISPAHAAACIDAVPENTISDLIERITDVSAGAPQLLAFLDREVIRAGYDSLRVIAAVWSVLCFEAQVSDGFRAFVGREYGKAGLHASQRGDDGVVLKRFCLELHNCYKYTP